MVWHHLLIQLVYARDMVRLAQCICTMCALFRNIRWSHLSRMHCHDFVHVCMCEYAVSVCFDLNYRRVHLCVSPSQVLFSHVVSLCVVVVYLFVGLPWVRRHSSADIVASLYRSLITMPKRMFTIGTHCSSEFVFV